MTAVPPGGRDLPEIEGAIGAVALRTPVGAAGIGGAAGRDDPAAETVSGSLSTSTGTDDQGDRAQCRSPFRAFLRPSGPEARRRRKAHRV